MALKYRRPYGTEDVVPANNPKWETVESAAKYVASEYGFREIRIPTFESTDLFQRSVGETTDVVQKEMYTVTAGDSEFTLRPEGTSGTIRAICQNGLLNDALPLKVFYILSCFRHERPQAGRLREFHQFGVEMAGSESPKADAEVISLGNSVLDRLGLKKIKLNINSIGCKSCRKDYTDALRKYFSQYKSDLCEDCKNRLDKNPMRILDCKVDADKDYIKNAPIITDYLCDECSTHFKKLQEYLKSMNIDYQINPRIVRGLDYYTKTVFEFVTDEIGAQGTVLGGGRYDGLIETLGGKPTPALGFGMGIERIILLMKKQNARFEEYRNCDMYIIPMDEEYFPKALELANAVRKTGFMVEFDLMDRSFRSQMKYANKIGAKYLLVLGENEIKSGKADLKNMQSGKISKINIDKDFAENYMTIHLDDVISKEDLDMSAGKVSQEKLLKKLAEEVSNGNFDEDIDD